MLFCQLSNSEKKVHCMLLVQFMEVKIEPVRSLKGIHKIS